MLAYDPRTASYSEDNVKISDDNVKRIILLFLLLVADELEALARRAAAGEITLEQFQRPAIQTIKSAHIAAALLGAGAPVGLSMVQRGLLESDLRFNLGRLEDFVRRIEERTFLRARSAQMIGNRIRLYAAYANQIFERARREAHETAREDDGNQRYTEEKNVLGNAEHCVGCVNETNRGWVRIGSLSLPGTRICRSNCRCRIVYR